MKKVLIACAVLIFSGFSSVYGEVLLGAGAGYQKPLEEVLRLYEAETGDKVSRIYGNLFQITEQAKQTGKIDIIVGDERFIDTSKLDVAAKQPIGRGVLVLVFSKKTKLASLGDLTKSEIEKIAAADPNKAIYGIAASEFLKNKKLQNIEHKMIYLASVPQVSMYLSKGEVDAGFLNISDYLALKDNFGAMVEIDKSLYTPIIISAAPLKESAGKNDVKKLLKFFKRAEAKAVFKKYGLEK